MTNVQCRLIGDSQMHYWYLAVECFLSPYLERAPRAAPTNNSAANLWLVKFDEWRDLKGSPKSSPKPAICAVLQVRRTCKGHLWSTQHVLDATFHAACHEKLQDASIATGVACLHA